VSIVTSDPMVLFGTPVFRGTKVPAEALFDYLEAGESLESFLRDFPTVSRETAMTCIQAAGRVLIDAELLRS